ncbi:MAG: N-acetyl-gamma-glutamyl-phosphate reductase [archaeon]
MINAGVVGSGNAGAVLLSLLLRHPKVNVNLAVSTSHAGKRAENVLGLQTDLVFSELSVPDLNKLDVVFLAVPHGNAKHISGKLACRVIDLSSDNRLSATYGLPEINKDAIKASRLVANPGCYATACILSAYPLKDYIDSCVFDCISGYSGGGKNPPYDYKENIIAYSLTDHFHLAEIQMIMGMSVDFTPHVVDVFKGLMCTAHLKLKQEMRRADITDKYRFYARSFTEVVDGIPDAKGITDTPYCRIGGFAQKGESLVIVSVIDNLMKGASSQAIENMNIMFGLGHEEGLE